MPPEAVPQATMTEDQFMSPSDRLKDMILKRWIKAEDFFDEVQDINFARTTKSLSRMFGSVLSDDERHRLSVINRSEKKMIEFVKAGKKSLTTDMEKEIHAIQVQHAEDRIHIISLMLTRSSVIQRDIEADFYIEDSIEAGKRVAKLISEETDSKEVSLSNVPKVIA
jgi:hypothetical protein